MEQWAANVLPAKFGSFESQSFLFGKDLAFYYFYAAMTLQKEEILLPKFRDTLLEKISFFVGQFA